MSRIEKFTAEFNKAKVETAWLILAIVIMLINSTAYAEVRKGYYESGQLKAELNYKYGKREGICKFHYDSGQLQLKVNFKDGKRHGLTKEYRPNGNVLYIDTYKNGTKIHRKMYDKRGKLEFEEKYPIR